jgi:sugar (pentulose or hexulose) kinase
MAEAGVEINELALSGGGAKTEGWPEIIADVTGKEVKIFAAGETVTTVLYAILASVLRNGSFKDILGKVFPEPNTVLPGRPRQETYGKNYRRYLRFLEAKLNADKSLRS